VNRGLRPSSATRGGRLLQAMWNRSRRIQDTPLVATRAEVARLAVLRAAEDLAAAAALELAVTPYRRSMPARRRLAIARAVRDAIRADFIGDSNDQITALSRRLYPEETP
jgi:hypothetical protein